MLKIGAITGQEGLWREMDGGLDSPLPTDGLLNTHRIACLSPPCLSGCIVLCGRLIAASTNGGAARDIIEGQCLSAGV